METLQTTTAEFNSWAALTKYLTKKRIFVELSNGYFVLTSKGNLKSTCDRIRENGKKVEGLCISGEFTVKIKLY